jgi:hypothetical protein
MSKRNTNENSLRLHFFLQEREQGSIKIVPLPNLEFGRWSFRIEHSKGAAEVPQAHPEFNSPKTSSV